MRTEDYIPKRVKELCSKHKVSKYRLAQLTDMSQTALGNIIKQESIPTIPTLERICDAFGISLAQFFAGDGMRPDLTDEQEEILETWDNLNADERRILMILSILVDTFISKISLPMQPVPEIRSISGA